MRRTVMAAAAAALVGGCGAADGRAPDLVTLLGGGGPDRDSIAQACAVGADGSLYLAGATTSPRFPVTPNAFQTTHRDASTLDAFVTKLAPDGRTLEWSTYVGGTAKDKIYAIAVDEAGHVYATGATDSADFPATPDAWRAPNAEPPDIFVLKLAPDGSRLVYSLRIGGAELDETRGPILVDAEGGVSVVGHSHSADFPTTRGAVQPRLGGRSDAVVFRLAPAGDALVYGTFLGGSGNEMAFGLRRGPDGADTLAGWTRSQDFPVTEGAFQTRYGGHAGRGWGGDAFVARLAPDGGRLVWSTFFGGPGPDSSAGNDPLALDAAGRPVLVGVASPAGVPTTPGAFRPTAVAGKRNGYVMTLSADGARLVAATYTGGTDALELSGTAVDDAGRVYHGGRADAGFPTTANAFRPRFGGGPTDTVLSVFSPDLSTLLYSTYLGGSGGGQESTRCLALASDGRLWMSGDAGSADFPTTPGAYQRDLRGETSAFGALWPATIATPPAP